MHTSCKLKILWRGLYRNEGEQRPLNQSSRADRFCPCHRIFVPRVMALVKPTDLFFRQWPVCTLQLRLGLWFHILIYEFFQRKFQASFLLWYQGQKLCLAPNAFWCRAQFLYPAVHCQLIYYIFKMPVIFRNCAVLIQTCRVQIGHWPENGSNFAILGIFFKKEGFISKITENTRMPQSVLLFILYV